MNDMPLSKAKMYKIANTFVWTISRYHKEKCIKTQISFLWKIFFYQDSKYTKTLIIFIKVMPLSSIKYIKTLVSFYERYASIKIKIKENTNNFLWTICLYQNSKYIKTLITFMNDMPLSKV